MRNNRNFRLLWIGQTISQVGDALFDIAIIWLALELSDHDPLAVGLLASARSLPYLFIGFLGGAYSDRWERRTLMIIGDTLRALVVLSVPVLNWLGHSDFIHLVVITLVLTTVRAFFHPSLLASVSMLVAEESLISANAMLQVSFQIGGLIAGPLLAGILLNVISPFDLLALDSLTFFLSVISLLLIRFPSDSFKSSSHSLTQDVRAVWQGLKERPQLAWTLVLFGLEVALISGAMQVGFPLLVHNIRPDHPESYAFLVSAMGIGAFGGSMLIQWFSIRRYAAWILGGWIIWGLVLAAFGMLHSFSSAVALSGLLGAIGPFVDVPMTSLIQSSAPKDQLGKVFSVWSTLANIGDSISAAVTGALLVWLPLTVLLVGSGLSAAILGAWGYRKVTYLQTEMSAKEKSILNSGEII